MAFQSQQNTPFCHSFSTILNYLRHFVAIFEMVSDLKRLLYKTKKNETNKISKPNVDGRIPSRIFQQSI